MPKQTRQTRLIAALEAIGYARAPGRSTHYVEMRLGPNGRSLLKAGNEDHRVLVGPRSLRFTTGTVAQSVPFSERTVMALLDGKLEPVAVRTTFEYPPIPDRRWDWSAIDDDTYDGAPDGPRCPVGQGATEAEAIADLMEQLDG